jgi:hypothetical protein
VVHDFVLYEIFDVLNVVPSRQLFLLWRILRLWNIASFLLLFLDRQLNVVHRVLGSSEILCEVFLTSFWWTYSTAFQQFNRATFLVSILALQL